MDLEPTEIWVGGVCVAEYDPDDPNYYESEVKAQASAIRHQVKAPVAAECAKARVEAVEKAGAQGSGWSWGMTWSTAEGLTADIRALAERRGGA